MQLQNKHHNKKPMRISFLLTLILVTTVAQGQSPCDNVKLYDQMVVTGDQPRLHKLKRFDIKLVPDSTLLKMKNEIIKITSPEFYSGLKIKSVKLFDSAVATAWSWTNAPITDKYLNPVYHFYAVLFETTTSNGTPFVFRLDVLKNGELLNEKQITFFKNEKLNIVGCEKLMALVLADAVQPIHSIEYMALAYSPKEQAVIWTIASIKDPKTGIQYYKEVNAATGAIIRRTFSDDTPPEVEKVENKKGN
jgi:hypothetical protein